MPVAATFDLEFDDGSSLGELARLDTMVTVVDASTFLTEVTRGDTLSGRDLAAADGDARSIADLLVDQVEFADVLLVSKTDLVNERTAHTVETMLRHSTLTRGCCGPSTGARGCAPAEAFEDLATAGHDTGIGLGTLASALVTLAAEPPNPSRTAMWSPPAGVPCSRRV